MRIRPATPEDAAAIAALWNPWITGTAITFNPSPKTAEEVAQMIATRQAAGHGFEVAMDGGAGAEDAILGFVTFAQFRAGAGYARSLEHTIILAPQARGRGIGRALMTAAETRARAGGGHQMFAGISAENPEGRAFHAALGYALLATLPEAGWKFGRFIDLWLMVKRL